MEEAGFHLPGPTERVLINGRTGSGKTVFGSWLLSRMNFLEMPWVILDWKRDELLGGITHARQIGPGEKPPYKPWLYHMKLDPGDNDLEKWLQQVWARGGVGLYVDEGYELPDVMARREGSVVRRIQTQGRSLRIPVITLTQRPSMLSKFFKSEVSYYAAFDLNDEADQKTVKGYVPKNDPVWNFDMELPDYHCRWYEVANNFSCILKPVPKPAKILAAFEQRLSIKPTWV